MKIRAIVFDDEDTIRSLLTFILKSRGYEVFDFPNPGFCPMNLDKECPCAQDHICADIIISDVNMPKITGLEFLENRVQKGCKVRNRALLSGGWKESEIEQAKRLGCQIFEKPFKLEEIIQWLEECEKRIDLNRELADLTDKLEGKDEIIEPIVTNYKRRF